MALRIRVEEPGDHKKVTAFDWIACGVVFVVFVALAYVALAEQSITLGGGGGKVGGLSRPTWYSGNDAVVVGFVLLAVAFAALGYALRQTVRWVSWTLLAIAWIGTLAWYMQEKM